MENDARSHTFAKNSPPVRLNSHEIRGMANGINLALTNQTQKGGTRRDAIMTSDERYILEQLLQEIDFFQKGGVVRLLDTPWLLKSLFQDSLIYLDHSLPRQIRPCGECRPFNFVAASHDLDDVPCHHTFRNEVTVRIGAPDDYNAQPGFEDVLTNWLRARITELRNTSH